MADQKSPRSKTTNYAKLRTRFGLAFVVSTLLFIVVSLCVLTNLFTLRSPSSSPTVAPTHNPDISPTDGPEPIPAPPLTAANPTDTFAILASIVAIGGTCLTSLITLAGFVITAAISFRQERRESKVSDLERQRQELELEKQRLELEKMKRERDKGRG
jgi:hypothetical protein